MIKWEDVVVTTIAVTIDVVAITVTVAEIAEFPAIVIAGSIITFVKDVRDMINNDDGIRCYTIDHVGFIYDACSAVIFGGGAYGRIPILPVAVIAVATLPGAIAADIVQFVKSPIKTVKAAVNAISYDNKQVFDGLNIEALNAMAAHYCNANGLTT